MDTNQSASDPAIFDLLEVAAKWSVDALGPCVGDDDVSSDADPVSP
jgi:hypothetical protein